MKTAASITDSNLVILVSQFCETAWETDPHRPPLAGNWHGVALPRVHDGEDWRWCRVATRGTGNGGYWVPVRPLSDRAKTAWWDYMAEMQALMPAVDARVWIRQPHAMEPEALAWIGRLGLPEARCIEDLRIPTSWKELRELEDRGWAMPRCKSIPRVASAMRALRASIK